MTTPAHEGVSRRDFFSLSAVLVGGITLGDLFPAKKAAASAATTKAEALDLTMDASGWLTRAFAEKARQEKANQEVKLPEPEDPFTRFLDQADVIFRTSPGLHTLTFNNIS